MNAYELAEELDKFSELGGDIFFGVCADMLRQQADQIAELKNARDYWCLQYKDVINKLNAIQDGSIDR